MKLHFIDLTKRTFLILNIIIGLAVTFNSCNKEDDNSNDKTTTTSSVVVDYRQAINTTAGQYFNYEQNGLNVAIIDDEHGGASAYLVNAGSITLFSGSLEISNIENLKNLNEISFKWETDSHSLTATLYDEEGNIIEQKIVNNTTRQGTFVFNKTVGASRLVISGYEDNISSITFK